MPFINISISKPTISKTQKQKLFDETTRLMTEVLGKNAELTSVRIDQFPPDSWAINKTSMTDRDEIGVHMDIKITAGTNTDDEKADMIKQAMMMIKDIIGATPEASYIVIHELKASSWGYDGQTQAARAMQTV